MNRFAYGLASFSALLVMAWLSVRVYDDMIGRIFFGSSEGFLASSFHLGSGAEAAIYYSKLTAARSPSAEKYGAVVVAWRRALGQQGIQNDVVDDRRLLSGDLGAYKLLVVPMAACLSDKEADAIRAFASQKDHGLILNGAAGAFRENGDWREVSLAAEIVGGEDIREVTPEKNGAVYTLLDGRSPLSANLPPGLRMQVKTYDRPVTMSLLELRSEAAGWWIEDRSPGGISNKRVSLAIGTYGGGRFVWTGFTPESLVAPYGVKAGETLVRNLVAYAAFRPIFGKEPWPLGRQAAVAFAQETDGRLDSSGAGSSLFSARRIPCTFFCAPDSARRDPGAFKRLASQPGFEIGLQGSPEYGVGTRASQEGQLWAGRQVLQGLGARTVAGYSPWRAAYDGRTLSALRDAGFSYLAGDPAGWGPPEALHVDRPKLWSLGRNFKLLISLPHAGLDDADLELERLKRDFDAVYRIGGFYNLSFHSSLLRKDQQAQVLSKFLDYVKTKNVWLATYGEVADWSDRWMLVDIDSKRVSEVRSSLLVSNRSENAFDSLRLDMFLPGGGGSIAATSEKLGDSISVLSQQEKTAVLEIRGLRGQGLVFNVDGEPVSGSSIER
jgi:peptidoglycan/xylan/chitin deacetylase (PgdA/CDA1 family)